MAINFDTLKTSEDSIRRMFLRFYEHVLSCQEYLLKCFKKRTHLTKQQYNHILVNEKRCNQLEAEILDEASWVISKDMPRASHLRYLIAVIRSIRDLERMGDFVERVATILQNQKEIDPEIKTLIVRIMQNSFNFVKEIYRNLKSGLHQSKYYYTERASNMFYEFSQKYRASFKEVGRRIFTKKKDLNSKVAIFTAIKNLERNADHAFNIIENFVYISDPNFYFGKESRKMK